MLVLGSVVQTEGIVFQASHLFRGELLVFQGSRPQSDHFTKQVLTVNSPRLVDLGTTPHPVAVSSSIISTFLVGNPYEPSFVTVTEWGVRPKIDLFATKHGTLEFVFHALHVATTKKILLGGGFKYFSFSSLPPGEMIQLANIFQIGWNHQLDYIVSDVTVLYAWNSASMVVTETAVAKASMWRLWIKWICFFLGWKITIQTSFGGYVFL